MNKASSECSKVTYVHACSRVLAMTLVRVLQGGLRDGWKQQSVYSSEYNGRNANVANTYVRSCILVTWLSVSDQSR